MLTRKLYKATRELDDQLFDAVNLICGLVNATGKHTEEESALAAEAGDHLCELHTIIMDITDILEELAYVSEKLSGRSILAVGGGALDAPSRSPKEVAV